MAESALSLGYPDIAQDVAEYLGYDDTIGNLGTDETRHLNQAMDSGLRMFLHPIDPRTNRMHDWSFLYSTTTITTVSGTDSYALPDNYGFHQNFIYYPEDEGQNAINIVGIGAVRNAQASAARSGYIRIGAIVDDSNFDGTDGQRFQVVFYPDPDQAWNLVMPYRILAERQLRTATPYPLGGMAHAETIRYACLAAAELDLNDEIGPRNARYREFLMSSIDYDRKTSPSFVGYNRDLSVEAKAPYENYYVTINGVVPS